MSFFILLNWHLLFFEVTTLCLVLVKHWNSMIYRLKAIILVIQLFINTSKTWCLSLNIESLVLGHKRCNKVFIIIHSPSNFILFTFFHPYKFVGLFHFFENLTLQLFIILLFPLGNFLNNLKFFDIIVGTLATISLGSRITTCILHGIMNKHMVACNINPIKLFISETLLGSISFNDFFDWQLLWLHLDTLSVFQDLSCGFSTHHFIKKLVLLRLLPHCR